MVFSLVFRSSKLSFRSVPTLIWFERTQKWRTIFFIYIYILISFDSSLSFLIIYGWGHFRVDFCIPRFRWFLILPVFLSFKFRIMERLYTKWVKDLRSSYLLCFMSDSLMKSLLNIEKSILSTYQTQILTSHGGHFHAFIEFWIFIRSTCRFSIEPLKVKRKAYHWEWFVASQYLLVLLRSISWENLIICILQDQSWIIQLWLCLVTQVYTPRMTFSLFILVFGCTTELSQICGCYINRLTMLMVWRNIELGRLEFSSEYTMVLFYQWVCVITPY